VHTSLHNFYFNFAQESAGPFDLIFSYYRSTAHVNRLF